ncbi:MAG TPA: hypothetical protein VFB36_05790 [Nevskiaceae bacterium]|nr:hypothetical protein [Nevskiaceae bacterium]
MNRIAAAVALLATAPAWSCDLCAVYSADQAQGQASGVYGAITEQFTRYGQLRDQGRRIDDDAGQYLDSLVMQLVLGYGFSDRASLQVALPYIHRQFSRPESEVIENGTLNGLGDVTLIGSYTLYRRMKEDSTFAARAFAGVKFATGDSDRLAEELSESDEAPAPGEPVSGIHGHDLAFGSGSTDFLFGASAQGRMEHWLARAETQYAYRRRGDFGYRFGNDLQWSAAFGRYLVLEDNRTFAVLAAAEGEYKQYDDLDGEQLGDTHCGGWMVGPKLQFTSQGRWSVDFGGLVPVQQFNSEIQTTASFRVRGAIGYRF